MFPLRLPDANGDGYSDESDFLDNVSNNQTLNSTFLNHSDLIGIYLLIDINKDGLISKREWIKFYKFFVKRFYLTCDKNGDFLLNEAEAKDCFLNETNKTGNLLNFTKLMGLTKYDGNVKQWTFLEFLKTKFIIDAWMNCSKNQSEINPIQFNNTLNISQSEIEIEGATQTESLYLTAQKLSRISLKEKPGNETMNFNVFFNLNLKFHRFLKVQRYLNKLMLNQREFLDQNYNSYGFAVDFPGYFLMKE